MNIKLADFHSRGEKSAEWDRRLHTKSCLSKVFYSITRGQVSDVTQKTAEKKF